MKTKYSLEELYAIMYKNDLQNSTFEDALAAVEKLEKVKAEVSKDAAPMIGLNPFSGTTIIKIEKPKSKDFNDSLNHRVSEYKDKAAK